MKTNRILFLNLSLRSFPPHLGDVDRVGPQGRVSQRVRLEAAREGLGDGLEREREELEDEGRHRVFFFFSRGGRRF